MFYTVEAVSNIPWSILLHNFFNSSISFLFLSPLWYHLSEKILSLFITFVGWWIESCSNQFEKVSLLITNIDFYVYGKIPILLLWYVWWQFLRQFLNFFFCSFFIFYFLFFFCCHPLDDNDNNKKEESGKKFPEDLSETQLLLYPPWDDENFA